MGRLRKEIPIAVFPPVGLSSVLAWAGVGPCVCPCVHGAADGEGGLQLLKHGTEQCSACPKASQAGMGLPNHTQDLQMLEARRDLKWNLDVRSGIKIPTQGLLNPARLTKEH